MSTIVITSSTPARPNNGGRAENRAGEAAATLDTAQPEARPPVVAGSLPLGILAAVAVVFALENVDIPYLGKTSGTSRFYVYH